MKLYLQNPYLRQFTAQVLDTLDWKGKTALILDRTAFYPTGGGQPHDTGVLGDYPVVEVEEHEGRILHLIEGEYRGEKRLAGMINWERRFDHMQQHAGQHLLSAVLKKMYGIETHAFHLGREESTIDISPFHPFPIHEVEEKIYGIVLENCSIETHYLPREEVDPRILDETKSLASYIRFVEIEGFEGIACQGTHPSRTGEIGLVKIIGVESDKENLRLTFLAGMRALRRFQGDMEHLNQALRLLKTNRIDFSKRMIEIKEKQESLKRKNRLLTQEKLEWEKRWRMREALSLGGVTIHFQFWEERSFQELKELAKIIIEEPGQLVLFATLTPAGQAIAACSQNIPYSMVDIVKKLFPDGKGGGSRVFAQMEGKREHLLERWETVYHDLKNELLSKG
ncbi:putative Alanyl-tRNA editing protein AlaX-L [[Clostridium] ultunense Esp]|uniref:alanyl-tRNA editing protein n=1 Tax=Thermicanus aegyptius TaxID=94009 RepID=UPI0002B70039|nr:alanyl-tRNA editing protein [Thermicanus aegyptius]CCQ98702.1 putative Alanyl-tRNA editing protein AlaX-L [[Clostridium] ultunense Esp]